MTSFQGFGGLRTMKSNDSDKMGKSRNNVVRPILKKLSQSEKSSLDLDRGWDEQDQQYWSSGWDGGQSSSSFYASGAAARAGSSKDVSFAIAEATGAGSGRRYHHSRSISGNSHVSVATSGSGNGLGITGSRPGATFVHPFQQMPRTATPPLTMSYANSLASFADRDYSPTITEDDDYDLDQAYGGLGLHNHGNSSSNHHVSMSSTSSNYGTQVHAQQPGNQSSYSQPNLISSAANPRRPSLASQRTNSSFSDSPMSLAPLRVNTGMRSVSTTPAQSSRLAHVSSQSDLNLHLASQSPTSSSGPASTAHRNFASPASPVAAMSPFSRSSIDGPGFPRMRAKSDLDTGTRAEHLRDARQKIQEKEKAKDEKYARKEIKQRERADNKRAHEAEKRAAAVRKEREAARRRDEIAALAEAMPPNSKHVRKMSATSSGRPSMSRPTRPSESEKPVDGHYNSMSTSSPPAFGNHAGGARHVPFQTQPRRSNTAKRKTHGAWTAFILWLRTRLLRMNSG